MASIVSAIYANATNEAINATLDTGKVVTVNNDSTLAFREAIREWVANGGVIAPYQPPPPLTDDQRIDDAFNDFDRNHVEFEAFFEIVNRILALEGSPAINRAALRNWLKAKLP